MTRHAYMATLGRANRWEEAMAEYREMRGEPAGSDAAPARETYSVAFDALLAPGGAEAAIAAVALEVGEGDGFIHGARAAAARASRRAPRRVRRSRREIRRARRRREDRPVPDARGASRECHAHDAERGCRGDAGAVGIWRSGTGAPPAGVVIDAGPGRRERAKTRVGGGERLARRTWRARSWDRGRTSSASTAARCGVDGTRRRVDVVDVASGEKTSPRERERRGCGVRGARRVVPV